jgi:hypothetical protein
MTQFVVHAEGLSRRSIQLIFAVSTSYYGFQRHMNRPRVCTRCYFETRGKVAQLAVLLNFICNVSAAQPG